MYTNNNIPTNFTSLQGLRVLVVDNNVDYCNLSTILLQIYGVEVQTASLAHEAVEIFRQWQPDVLVSDIALPYEDGCNLIRQIRTKAGERGESVLAIAVTGYTDEKILQRALNAGFDLCFTKPLDFDEFLTILASLVTCQQSCNAAQQICGNVYRHRRISFDQDFDLALPA